MRVPKRKRYVLKFKIVCILYFYKILGSVDQRELALLVKDLTNFVSSKDVCMPSRPVKS